MEDKKRVTLDDIAESGECPCLICSSQDVHKYFSPEEHERLEKLAPLPKVVEDKMRHIAKLLIKRIFDESKKNDMLKEKNI